MTRHSLRASLLLACLTAPLAAPAATTVTVKVTVVEEPCVINNNQAIEVDFGDIAATLGSSAADELSARYAKTLSYAVTCPAGATSPELKLKVDGTAAAGSYVTQNNVLKTSREGLGIAVSVDGTAMALGRWVNFSYPALPSVTVTPVRTDAGTAVPGGEFTASATMQVEYQ